MSKPEQVTRWLDDLGTPHESEALARLTNGRVALVRKIQEDYGPTPMLTINDVLLNIDEWYVIKLEATNG